MSGVEDSPPRSRNRESRRRLPRSGFLIPLLLLGVAAIPAPVSALQEGEEPEPLKRVKARVQTRAGGEAEEAEMPVYEVPVDPPSVAAGDASLNQDELVLGVVENGEPMAWPVRYLALYEVVDDQVGGTPLAPTW